MLKAYAYFKTLLQSKNKGQGMVEYGLIVGLIAVAVIVALTAMSGKLGDLFNYIAGKVTPPAG